MITKSEINIIRSLGDRAGRSEHGLFVVEGDKSIAEICNAGFKIVRMFTTTDGPGLKIRSSDMARISSHKSPPDRLALFKIPERKIDFQLINKDLTLVLDDVQDPGNLGTIIRLADWFGIKQIICSPATVDVFNQKTIQASMGSISRVNVQYIPLEDFFKQVNNIPIFGTFLEGEDIYTSQLSHPAIIVMGNEGKGISDATSKFTNRRITIPPYPHDATTVESLNVAMATAVVCSEFRRRMKK